MSPSILFLWQWHHWRLADESPHSRSRWSAWGRDLEVRGNSSGGEQGVVLLPILCTGHPSRITCETTQLYILARLTVLPRSPLQDSRGLYERYGVPSRSSRSPGETLARENNKTVSVSAGKWRQSERGNNSSTTGHTALEDNLPSKLLGWRYRNSLEVAHFKRHRRGFCTQSIFLLFLWAGLGFAISSSASCSPCGLRWIASCFCSCSQASFFFYFMFFFFFF